jgi:UbiD family decarboxylase
MTLRWWVVCGAAMELVHRKTIDVDVPAYAEVVFELEVDFTKEAFEGPLGEFTGITLLVQRNRSHG